MPHLTQSPVVMCNTMRILTLIAFNFISINIFGQTEGQLVTFNDVGWTIKVPADFKTVDSSVRAANVEKGKGILDSSISRKINMSKVKNLISAARDRFNYFIVNLSNSTSITNENWEAADSLAKVIYYKSFLSQMPQAKVDTTYAIETIDGREFKKFKIDLIADKRIIIHSFFLSKFYRGHLLSISYLYTDTKAGEEIENMLTASKFER